MKINIELDKALEETEVLIRAAKMTEEVNGILKKLEEPSVQMISGFAGDTLEILEQADIIRVYAAKGKVYAVTGKGEYLPAPVSPVYLPQNRKSSASTAPPVFLGFR